MAKLPYMLDRAFVDGAFDYVPATREMEEAPVKVALKAYRTFSLKPPSKEMASFLTLIAESPETVKFAANISDALEAATAPVMAEAEAKAAASLEATRPAGAKANPSGMSLNGQK